LIDRNAAAFGPGVALNEGPILEISPNGRFAAVGESQGDILISRTENDISFQSVREICSLPSDEVLKSIRLLDNGDFVTLAANGTAIVGSYFRGVRPSRFLVNFVVTCWDVNESSLVFAGNSGNIMTTSIENFVEM